MCTGPPSGHQKQWEKNNIFRKVTKAFTNPARIPYTSDFSISEERKFTPYDAALEMYFAKDCALWWSIPPSHSFLHFLPSPTFYPPHSLSPSKTDQSSLLFCFHASHRAIAYLTKSTSENVEP